MGRFDFQSPGAAVVDEMTKVLAERKAEERQQMLDKLTMSAEDRATRAEQRAATAAQSQLDMNEHNLTVGKEQARRERIKEWVNVLDPNVDPSTQLPPEAIAELVKDGWLVDNSKQPTASVETSEEFTPPDGVDGFDPAEPTEPGAELEPGVEPPGQASGATPNGPQYRFIGDQAYRQKEREKAEVLEEVIGMLNSGNPEQEKAGAELAQMLALTGGKLTAELIVRAIPKKFRATIFDPNNGTFSQGDEITEGAPTFNKAVQPRRTREWHNTGQVSKNGRVILANNDGEMKEGDIEVGNDNQSPVGIPPGLMNRLDEVTGVLMSDVTDATAVGTFKLTAKRAASQAKQGSQNAKRWVGMYIDSPNAAAQALATGQMNLTPEEQADAQQILSAVGAVDFKDVLIKAAPKPKPAPKPAPPATTTAGTPPAATERKPGSIRW